MFLYVLTDPRTDEIRYVGITKGDVMRRWRAHLGGTGRTRSASWVKSLLPLKPGVRVIEVHESIEELKAAEIWWIAHLRSAGHRLTNHTSGGDGRFGDASPRTTAWRQNLSSALKGNQNAAGHVCSDEAKRKISDKAKTRQSGFKGKQWTPEMKAKASATHRANWARRKALEGAKS